jgi:NAD-dependent dihydropyrimidine dehydrogenase PreA subunit
MGLFIKVEIDLSTCKGRKEIADWAQVCPVNIFAIEDNLPIVVAENEDECTLCMLCIEAFPEGAITIHKLYELRKTQR